MNNQTQGKREEPLTLNKMDDPHKWYIEIYNIPLHFNKDDIVYFIWKTLDKCRALRKPTNPIVRSDYLEEARCIRLFFRSSEETVNCLDLNGILYGEKAFYMKSPLQTREIPLIKTDGLQIKRFRQRVADGFNKLCIQNLPPMQEFEILNILRGYGEIKAFQLAYAGHVLTHCFCEYETSEATEDCLAKLNHQKMRNKTVSVKRAVMGRQNSARSAATATTAAMTPIKVRSKSSLFEKNPLSFYLTFDTVGYFNKMKISCILMIRNLISSQVDQEFVKQDIKREVDKVGKVSRFISKDRNIYIQYERVEYAQIAYLLFINRKYDGKSIEVLFYDPINFADDILI